MSNPLKGEIWRFKSDGKPNNKKYWLQLAEVLNVTATDVTYQFVDRAIRNPSFPNGIGRTLVSFLNKFEGPVSAGNLHVAVEPASDNDVQAFLGGGLPTAVPVARKEACSSCTDDSKPLKNGKCFDCIMIKKLITKFGQKFTVQDYYGIDVDPGA